MTAGYAPAVDFQRADAPTLASRALVNDPGTFSLERATGMPIAAYARRHLFEPLGIRDVAWPSGRDASGLLLRPRELLAFGELYLHHGNGIVPASWVRLSTRAHSPTYGYGWWIRPHSYSAYGYLGQVLAVYPQRDEVVLVTSSREDAKPLELVRRIAGE